MKIIRKLVVTSMIIVGSLNCAANSTIEEVYTINEVDGIHYFGKNPDSGVYFQSGNVIGQKSIHVGDSVKVTYDSKTDELIKVEKN